MENLTLEQTKQVIRDLKAKRARTYSRITGLDKDKIGIVNDNFIVFNAKSLEDIKGVLTNLKPSVNSVIIKHGNDRYDLISNYKIECINNFYNRQLKIVFVCMGVEFWIKIDIKDLPQEFADKFLHPFKRSLYSTESHYVNIPSHYKKFKDIRIDAYSFNSSYKNLSWYGGDITLICEEGIREIINYLKL